MPGVRQPVWLTPDEVPPLPAGWTALPTAEACIQLKPGKLFDSKTVFPVGRVPVLNQSESGALGFHDEIPGVDASPNEPVVTFANHTCAVRLMKEPFSVIQNIFPKVGKPGLTDTVYFYYASLGRVSLTDYKGHHPTFRQAHIPIPPLPVQRRIAGILSAYDDLIENSHRRIKILESMARALYREWFVHFRFPGHENHPRVASSLGSIPNGWEARTLGDVITYSRRATKPGPHLEDRRYVPIDCLPPNSLALLEVKPIEEAQSSLQLFEKGDILFGAMRPYFHKVVVAPFSGVTRSTCFVFKPVQPEWHSFATITAFDEATVAYANAHSQGATIPYAVWDGSLSEMPLVLPSTEVLQRFEVVVAPMLSQLAQSFFVLGNLRRTRDLLLPRLLSGQIELDELEAA